jgi:hypothetical protein
MLAKLAGDAQLAGVGIAEDPFAEHRARPLLEHLEDFHRYLVAKGASKKYREKTVAHVRDILKGCHFARIGDVQPAAVVEFLAGLREDREPVALDPAREWYAVREAAALLGIKATALRTWMHRGPVPGPPIGQGPGGVMSIHRDTLAAMLANQARGRSVRTTNDWLSSAKRFTKWLVRERRAPFDPLAHLSRQNAKVDQRHRRRPSAPTTSPASRGASPRPAPSAAWPDPTGSPCTPSPSTPACVPPNWPASPPSPSTSTPRCPR